MKRDAFVEGWEARWRNEGHELIVDNFAGGGGTSQGISWALGREPDIAINHDPEALAMHAVNHPNTKHLCESVWDVDPVAATYGMPVGLVWLSPDCKHFSRAKGGTPVDKKIRGLAWVGLRWAATTKPRIVALENVAEFTTWGPLISKEVDVEAEDGTITKEVQWLPDPKKKGVTFNSFVKQLEMMGYKVEHRELRASDNNTPTIRKRLFLIARRDGEPIVWPEPTHGDPTSKEVISGKLLPHRTAAECIDFSIASKSIFDRKRPLVKNTMRRVAKGLWRHVLTSGRPYIVGAGGPTYSAKPSGVDQPFGTMTTENHRALTQPVLVPQPGAKSGGPIIASSLSTLRGTSEAHLGGDDITDPLTVVCASGNHHALIAANLLTIGHGERAGQDARTQKIQQPVNTVTAGGVTQALSAVHITKFRTDSSGASVAEPMPTVTANSFLKRPGGAAPLGIVAACMEQANGGFYDGDGHSVADPVSTITSAGSNQRLVTAYMVKFYSSGGQWQELHDPMHTVPTKDRMALVKTEQVSADHLSPDQLARARQCARMLRENLPEKFEEDADIVLMMQNGEWYVLVDITLRMLKPRELFNAQGFPQSYIIDEIPDPKLLFQNGEQVADPRKLPRIKLSEASQVRMCGNSVCPPMAQALIGANYSRTPILAMAA